MKAVRLMAVAVVVMLTAAVAGAQTDKKLADSWKVDSITVSGGEDALSSGITGSLWLTNASKKLVFNTVVQHEQAWFLVGTRYHLGVVQLDVAGSLGHFGGEFWVGPYIAASAPGPKVWGQRVTASGMVWPCIFAKEPAKWRNDGVKNPEALLAGTFVSVELAIGPFAVFLGGLDFLDDRPNKLPGASYTAKIGKNFAAKFSVTRNTSTQKWMYYMGTTWSPS